MATCSSTRASRDYYGPANRQEIWMLDDLLMTDDGRALVPYGAEQPTHALMGRFGNVFLVNGEPDRRHARAPRRSRAILLHQRVEYAALQPVVRRRADEGRRLRHRQIRARSLGHQHRPRARRALHRRRPVHRERCDGVDQSRAVAESRARQFLRGVAYAGDDRRAGGCGAAADGRSHEIVPHAAAKRRCRRPTSIASDRSSRAPSIARSR